MIQTLSAHIPPVRSLGVASLILPWLGPSGQEGGAPEGGDELRVYAPNQRGASVSVLDGGGRLPETVALAEAGFSHHPRPHHVAATRDGDALTFPRSSGHVLSA